MTSLIHTDPDHVDDGAASCAVIGERAAALARVLEIVARGEWQSPAGREFGARVREHLPALEGAGRRLLDTAAILRAFASELRDAQARAAVAQLAVTSAEDGVRILTDRIRHAGLSEAELVETRIAHEEYRREALAADARWHGLLEEWRATEAAFAARLRQVAQDGIRDDGWYRGLHSVQRGSDRVAMIGLVPGPQQVVTGPIAALAATASTGLTVSFKVGYDEGRWSDIGAVLALNRLKTLAKVTRAGAVALPRNGLARETPYTVADRMGLGLGQTIRSTYVPTWPPPSAVSKAVNPALPAKGVRGLVAKARARGGQWLDTRFRDDWAIATRDTRTTKRMLLTSWAMDGTAKTINAAQQAQALRERQRARRADREGRG